MSSSSTVPDESTLLRASDLEVYDIKGIRVKFGSIFAVQKAVIVFIRHFFCGACQAYVERLASIPRDVLEAAHTKIVVIGCGEWNPIQSYIETTGFQGQIFADPSRALYHALGRNIENLGKTPAGQQRRSYLTLGSFAGAIVSIWKGPLKNPSLIGKQGNISQLGGDFVLGPGPQCSFASRMQHTEDHVEVADLVRAAGVVPPA